MKEKSEIEKLQEQLEYLFVRVIVGGLRDKSMTIPEVKQDAQDFLAIEPFTSVEDARAKINAYTSTHSRFSLLKEYSDVYYDEERLEDKMEQMRAHLKENNIEGALSLIEEKQI